MKNLLLLLLPVALLSLSCKKHNEPVNIKLKDKPLPLIKKAIQGEWQLHYAYGGWTGYNRVDYVNAFIKFQENHMRYSHGSQIIADAPVYWKRVVDIFSQRRDSIYIITFRDTPGWVVDGIYQDTLLLVDYGSDPMNYYLTRKK